MTVLAILQARTSSRRLPNKVLADVLGRPMLARQLERIRRAKRIDALVVATSDARSDDAIESLCVTLGVACFRGPLHDVLARFAGAARAQRERHVHVVRLTGDCPLSDPELIDAVVELHVARGADYTSNTLERRYPDGLDVEAMRLAALCAAQREATSPAQREHVTPYLYEHPERFALASLRCERALGHLRWTVDEPADLRFVQRVYAELHLGNPGFGWRDVLALVEGNAAFDAVRGGAA
jgi:spore coat polysaccharide biosynthesis protein SpsF